MISKRDEQFIKLQLIKRKRNLDDMLADIYYTINNPKFPKYTEASSRELREKVTSELKRLEEIIIKM